jgi:predicted ArsR family transcriptional regulator
VDGVYGVARAPITERQQKILAFMLVTDDWQTTGEIADGCGLTRVACRDALVVLYHRRLVMQRLGRVKGQKAWRITRVGVETLR